MNRYVLDQVSAIALSRARGGYDLHSAFTRDLKYGDECCIRASHRRPKTMCVAAVVEVLVEALNEYGSRAGDKTPFVKAPLVLWTSGNITSLRANFFQFKGTDSFGVGDTLAKFQMGERVKFENLIPGDFLNFSRNNGTGHAVVFLAYIDAQGNETTQNAPSDIGFRYFSAQGRGKPDAGFAYRWAYFDEHCPAHRDAAKLRDCGVIRSPSIDVLGGGRLWSPNQWNVSAAKASLEQQVRAAIINRSGNLTEPKITALIAEPLEPRNDNFYSGDTLD